VAMPPARRLTAPNMTTAILDNVVSPLAPVCSAQEAT
jgi:hypothetical protein